MITELKSNEIFVFGSNKLGHHLGGAARRAYVDFGAEWGVGEGITGKCYAFPTLDESFNQISDDYLELSRNKIYKTAEENQDKTFLLTPVGTGIAGFSLEKIDKLFSDCPKNINKLWKQQ